MDLLFNKTMVVLVTIFAIILATDYILGTIVSKKNNLYSSDKGNEGLMKKFIAFILFTVVVLVIDFADMFDVPTIEQYLGIAKIAMPPVIVAYSRKELASIVANLSLIFEFDVGDFLSKTLSADQELQSKIRKLDNSKAKIIVLDNTLKQIEKDDEKGA
ncbi:hypothetical protein BG261_02760 [Floricoccus tropicus]|uniref:Holin n=1 Tax=Floricoccus tropicus TaxID=1859473 RepID=A0A1E8GMY2_9LACT|nr:phage holin family protein [Floricoccus tropicus]OFI49517.1 hypothetical protein BG261_02760 [Floricoccus tropicus]